jgi:hypothetical protein
MRQRLVFVGIILTTLLTTLACNSKSHPSGTASSSQPPKPAAPDVLLLLSIKVGDTIQGWKITQILEPVDKKIAIIAEQNDFIITIWVAKKIKNAKRLPPDTTELYDIFYSSITGKYESGVGGLTGTELSKEIAKKIRGNENAHPIPAGL